MCRIMRFSDFRCPAVLVVGPALGANLEGGLLLLFGLVWLKLKLQLSTLSGMHQMSPKSIEQENLQWCFLAVTEPVPVWLLSVCARVPLLPVGIPPVTMPSFFEFSA